MEEVYFDKGVLSGRFIMLIPEDALPEFYEMLLSAPLRSRRWFYGVKQHLEDHYKDEIVRKEVRDE